MDEFEKWDEATDYSHFVSPYTVAKAAWKAGREAGMREAAGLCEKRADFIRGQQSGPQDELSNVILRHHASAHREAMESILSAIEGAK